MKRLPTLLSCLFLLTACQKDSAMPTAASSPQPRKLTNQKLTKKSAPPPKNSSPNTAISMPPPGHTSSNSAARPCRRTCRPCWTKCTTTPKPRSPPAASSPSVRSKSPACNPKPKTATPPPPSASPNTTAWPPDSPPKTNAWPTTGTPKPPAPAKRNKTAGKKRLPETQRSKVSAKPNFQVAFFRPHRTDALIPPSRYNSPFFPPRPP